MKSFGAIRGRKQNFGLVERDPGLLVKLREVLGLSKKFR